MEILITINKYIRNKFEIERDIFYSDGTRYLLLDFHSCSGDTSLHESILIVQVPNEDQVKDWVRTKLQNLGY